MGSKFGAERTVELFCDQFRKQRQAHVSQFVSAVGAGNTALRAEANRS